MSLIIGVEGLPGCGKTTIIGMLKDELRSCGLQVEMVDVETIGHAPTLRAIARTYPLGHPARILLFWVLRIQQYDTMQEMLDKADIIFADRFWGSTIAFDVYGNGVPRELLDWVGQHIKRQPDITLLFEAPLCVVRERKEATTMGDPSFARRVERGYQELANIFSWVRVDATLSPARVREACLQAILPALRNCSDPCSTGPG
ncbi:MAG: thymidylate kinase [Parcubacteria group bacterium]|nr:thymidylate kinase [Parcubacteria group bacterium]